MASGIEFETIEAGVFSPKMRPVEKLEAGEVGYIATGLKDIRLAQVGDTVTSVIEGSSQPLPGYQPPQLMVYMDFYPVDGDDYELLKDGLNKLMLNDSALQYMPTHSTALGNGVRVGFLGILHAEIVQERLEREFNLDLIGTTPSVTYEIELAEGKKVTIHNPVDLPDPTKIKKIYEPVIKATIFTPRTYLGQVIQLLENHRSVQDDLEFYGDRVKMHYRMPLAELIVSFIDELKSATQGYASMQYEMDSMQPIDAVKLSILVNHEEIEALSHIVVRRAYHAGYAHILDLPEFYDIDVTRSVLLMLDEANMLLEVLRKARGEGDIHILLGDDFGNQLMEPVGMVYTDFETRSHKGTIGVIGSSRLDYAYVVPLVRHFGQLIGELSA
jgi:GTP-binding protein LepA